VSVISTLEAVPNRLRILWEVLRDIGDDGIKRKELQKIISPISLDAQEDKETSNTANTFRGALGALVEIGLAKIIKDSVSLTAISKESSSEGNITFISEIERTLLSPGTDIYAENGSLAGALAWLLTREPTQPLSWNSAPAKELQDDLGDNGPRFDLTNKERWQTFAYWARFLGYASIVEIDSQVWVIPDSSKAIRRHLDSVLPNKKEVPFKNLISGLSSKTPLFEEGSARISLESKFPSDPKREARILSPSTAFSLRRLEVTDNIKLILRSDAEIWVASGLSEDRISHVKKT
jgi:hypothetical protein